MSFDFNNRITRICAAIEASDDSDDLHVVLTLGANVEPAWQAIAADSSENFAIKLHADLGNATLESCVNKWTKEREDDKRRVLVVDIDLAMRLLRQNIDIENDRDIVHYHLCADPAIVLGARHDAIKLLAMDATSSSKFSGFNDDQRKGLLEWARSSKPGLKTMQEQWRNAGKEDEDDEEEDDCGCNRAPKSAAKVAAVAKAPAVDTIEFPRFSTPQSQAIPPEVKLQMNAHRLGVLSRTQMVTELGSRVIILTESATTALWFKDELKALKVEVAAFTNGQNIVQRRTEVENFNSGSVSVLIAQSSMLLSGVRLAIPAGRPLEVHSTYPMHQDAAVRNIKGITNASRCSASEVENWLWTRKDAKYTDVAVSPLVIKEALVVKTASEAAQAAIRERDDLAFEVQALRTQIAGLVVQRSPSDQIRAQAAGAVEVGMTGHQFGRLLDYTSALEKIVNRVASKPYLENDIASAALLGQQCVEDAKPSN